MDTHMATPRKEKSSTDTKIRKAISLKLLTDKNSNKVVFAEAGKDFVDFLFGLLEVPLGSIMRIRCRCDMAGSGSFGRVYESVKNLGSNYFQTNKESLLRPEMTSSSNTGNHPLLQVFGLKKRMSECGLQLIEYNPYGRVATPSKEEEGYVKGIVTYMVMDNLMVKPLSNISSYNLLKAQHVKDVNSLEEKTVEIDLKKGMQLMIASFESDTVLTDVFIGKKIVQPESNASASETSAFANTRIDWKETPEAHIFKADLPGLTKEEVKVEVEEGRILQIIGEMSKEQEEKNDKWHHVERSSGKFSRRFRLPENVKMGQVKASMKNGLLTVTVPKEEEKKPEVKAIEITG